MYTEIKCLDRIHFGYEDSIKLLQERFDYFKRCIEYDDLTDLEKYQLLTYFLILRYNTSDIINLINIKEGYNYARLVDIPTRMQCQMEHLEDNGSTKTNKNRLILTCAANETFELEKLVYSYYDILDLIKERKIYPVRLYAMPIHNYTEDKEPYKDIITFIPEEIKIEVDECTYWRDTLSITPNDQNIPIMVKYLEKVISRDDLFDWIKFTFKRFLDSIDPDTYKEKELCKEMMEYYNTYFKGKRKVKKAN